MNTHIGDKIFQDTSRCVAKFRENRPGTSKYLWRKKDKTRPKYNSRPTPLSLKRYAGDCKKISVTFGVAYDGAAASPLGTAASAQCPVWHGLRPAGDMAIGDRNGFRAPQSRGLHSEALVHNNEPPVTSL